VEEAKGNPCVASCEVKPKHPIITLLAIFFVIVFAGKSYPWHDETHIAIAKAAGYKKWYNATGADMIKLKAGYTERLNHYTNNLRGTIVTPEMVLKQIEKYNKKTDVIGHLYGAIIASLRDYLKEKHKGKYGEYHLAFCVHYIGDLSQPLHNTLYNSYNRKNHKTTDGIINDEVLENIDKIKIYSIKIESEEDLANEIARIANLSLKKGCQIQDEKRLLTKDEAYEQISHSASLFKAILEYVEKVD
jgi:pentose-5-phosphate-3-epimerase